MEEQTLIPVVQELVKLLTDSGHSDAAEKVTTSSTPQALNEYCDAFIQALLAPRIGRSWVQRTQNILTTLAEDKLIKQMQDVLRAHDELTLEFFKTKVINSLRHMEDVGKVIVDRSHELLSKFVTEADFIAHISQIINENGKDKAILVELVYNAAEYFKEKEVKAKAEEKAQEKEEETKPILSLAQRIERLMPRGLFKRELTEEEELRILRPIYDDKAVFLIRSEPTVTAKMDIDYDETVRVEILPARPQEDAALPAVQQPFVEEIPAAPLFDKVWGMFKFNKKKEAEETEVVVVAEEPEVVAPPEVEIFVTNNRGPSLLSRLNTFTASVKSAAESAASAVESAVNSLVAPKPSIRLSAEDDTFIQSEKKRTFRERCEKLNDEVRVVSVFLATAIKQHSDHLDAHVSYKLKVLSRDVTTGQEKGIQQEIIDQLSFYETARDENNVNEKNAAVEKAASRWWNYGFLKSFPILSYFYGKLKEQTIDYFESSLACEQIKMELKAGNKVSFNSNAEKYRTHFGEYINERFDKFFMKNEDWKRAGDALAPLEAEWKEKYGERIRYGYEQKPEIELGLELSVAVSAPARIQAQHDWGDLAAVAPADAPPKPTAPTLTRAIN